MDLRGRKGRDWLRDMLDEVSHGTKLLDTYAEHRRSERLRTTTYQVPQSLARYPPSPLYSTEPLLGQLYCTNPEEPGLAGTHCICDRRQHSRHPLHSRAITAFPAPRPVKGELREVSKEDQEKEGEEDAMWWGRVVGVVEDGGVVAKSLEGKIVG